MPRYILALDQGTTSSRAILFDESGQPCFTAQRPIRQSYPAPGWVEHDPLELYQSIVEVGQKVIAQAAIQPSEIAAIGVTNQRETTVLWSRTTGQPLHPAIVWQDRRTDSRCQELIDQGKAGEIRQVTGLELDPYFSATKLEWLLRSQPTQTGLAFGTVDSWLIYNLTRTEAHVTDPTNASRTMLLDLDSKGWSPRMLELFGVDESILPKVSPSSGVFGTTSVFGGNIPIAGIAGDQQAALFGQACNRVGMAKCTYGTGAFLVTSSDTRRDSQHHLLTTLTACSTAPWALEGSIFAAGSAVNWLSGLGGIFASPTDAEASAQSVPDSNGVAVVPAFAGLGAPYWDAGARAAIFGLTLASEKAHVARATFESVAHQCADVLAAIEADLGHPIQEMRVDGGLSQSDLLLQVQADYLGIPVVRSSVPETTALGTAFLAGIAVGFWKSEQEVGDLWKAQKTFEPSITPSNQRGARERWKANVKLVRSE